MSTTFPIPVIGLTGGIASGKSVVARLFREKFGVPVLDADQLARELSAPGGRAAPEILKRFGTLDRARIREAIFSDPKARADLEGLLHPLIREESAKRISELAAQGASLVVYEAALLVETSRYQEFDGLIVVEAPIEDRIARVMARDQISRELALSIIQAQASDESRRAAATYLLQNSGTVDELEKGIRALLVQMRVKAPKI